MGEKLPGDFHCKTKVPIRSLPTSCSHLRIGPLSYHCTSFVSLWSVSCLLEGRCQVHFLLLWQNAFTKATQGRQGLSDSQFQVPGYCFGKPRQAAGTSHITSTIKSRGPYMNARWLVLNSFSYGSQSRT